MMFNVTLINDDIIELTKFFQAGLRFSGAAPLRVTLNPATASITILDTDGE